MGYQPDLKGYPPGDPPLPLYLISPKHRARLDAIAQERHSLSLEDMHANLAYWRKRWKRLQGQRAFRKSTWIKRKRDREEASAACIAWSNRIRTLAVD